MGTDMGFKPLLHNFNYPNYDNKKRNIMSI